MVGHDDDRAAAALDGRPRGLGQQHRPVGVRVGGRDGEQGCRGRTARAHVGEERGARGVRQPGVRHPIWQWRSVSRVRRRGRQGLLGGGVPGWDGEAQHVTERAGVAVGDDAGHAQHRWREHGFGRHDPADRAEPPEVLGIRAPVEHEAGEVLPGEAHLDPHPRERGVGRRGRHGVLERPVEVGQARVYLDQGHREHLARRIPGHCHAPKLAEPTDPAGIGGLRLWTTGRPRQALAARWSASTRSVRSHVKGLSTPAAVVRPKCP